MTDATCKLLKAKESVLRFKNGSPKLKDVLRKKCKERLQKNRDDFVDKLRNISGNVDVYDTLTDFIKEDLKAIYTSDALKVVDPKPLYIPKDIEEEVLNEELEWLMNKYDSIFEDDECLAGMLEELNQVICPVCQKSDIELKEVPSIGSAATCKCGLVVPTTLDTYQIKENIMSCIDEHNSACNANPQFCVLNDAGENHVYLMCYACSGFHMLL